MYELLKSEQVDHPPFLKGRVMANTIYLRTYDDGELVERLSDQADILHMSLNQYCLVVLQESLFPDDELISSLADRALEITSRKRYTKMGLLPGERKVML